MRRKRVRRSYLKVIGLLVLLFAIVVIYMFIINNLNNKKASKQENRIAQSLKTGSASAKTKIVNQKPKVLQELKVDNKTVFLTIDDGPSRYFKEFTQLLQKEKIPTTFFFVGNELQKMTKENVLELKKANISVGLHSYTHNAKLLYRKNKPTFIQEMEQTRKAVKDKTGIMTNIIRAPYGSTYLNEAMYIETKKRNFKFLDWNIDSNDWRYQDDKGVGQSVLKQVDKLANKNEPLVILVHERKNTLAALPNIIKQLKKRGYHFQAYTEQTPFSLSFKEKHIKK